MDVCIWIITEVTMCMCVCVCVFVCVSQSIKYQVEVCALCHQKGNVVCQGTRILPHSEALQPFFKSLQIVFFKLKYSPSVVKSVILKSCSFNL